MPTPEQARLTLSTFRPQSVDDHEANLRAIDRAYAALPFTEEKAWRKGYGDAAFSWTPVASTFKQLDGFWWTKSNAWTRVRFQADVPIATSTGSMDVTIEVRFQTDSSPFSTPTRTNVIAARYIPAGTAINVSGVSYDFYDYPTSSLPLRRWYVRIGVVPYNIVGGPGTLNIYQGSTGWVSLQEMWHRGQ